jgi:hypothetical protein
MANDGKLIRLFNGATQTVDVTGGDGVVTNFRNNKANIYIFGTFGSGTVTIETQAPDGSTWIQERDRTGSAFSVTDDEIVPLGNLVYGQKIRLQLSGSTTPSIDAFIQRVSPD